MTKLDELIQELCPDGVKYKALGEICKLVTGATQVKRILLTGRTEQFLG